jgi:hypothetical protein
MKKLIALILGSLLFAGGLIGCQASIKGGELTSYLDEFKRDQNYKIMVTDAGTYIESKLNRAATTQRSTSTQPSAKGPADLLKNFKLGEGSLDTLSSLSVEFQKKPMTSIFLTLILLATAVIAWKLGHRAVALGAGALCVLSVLAPEIMVYGAIATVLGVAFLAYKKYTEAHATATAASATATEVTTQRDQVVKSVESAMDKWFTDPAQKADFKTYIKAGQDIATSSKVAEIIHKL